MKITREKAKEIIQAQTDRKYEHGQSLLHRPSWNTYNSDYSNFHTS